MAENEIEMNPCKRLKIEHNPDQNGDHTESEAPVTIPKAGTSKISGDNSAAVSDTGSNEKDDVCGKDMGGFHDIVDKHEVEMKGKDGGIAGEDKDDDDSINGMDRDARDVEISDAESDVSAFSDMSGLSGEDSWKAVPAGPMAWVYRCMEDGVNPRSILRQIISDDAEIPDVDDFSLWKLVVNLVSEPPPRNKLPDINTLEDVIHLLHTCEKIMVLTGAGVSVSCGIPDFRSRNGIYARLAVDFPDLPDPQAMFDIRYFRRDQRPFFKFAKEIYPGQFEPSRCHKFIRLIEEHGKLLRNYTQNIDTLEQVAGIKNVIQCHGSFATATCMQCHHKCSSDDIKEDIMNQVIPKCGKCDPQTAMSVMKPDIVFFGESLPEEFHHQMSVDKDNCDLLIVIGSSLKVRPVALIPNSLPAHVPQILINKEHLRNLNFDVELLGDCDIVVGEICRRLGEKWTKIASEECLTQISMDELLTPASSPKLEKSKPENTEPKVDNAETHVDKTPVNNENSGDLGSSNADVKHTSSAESSVAKTDDKCLCSETVSESKGKIKGESKMSELGEDLETLKSTQKETDNSVERGNTSGIVTKSSESEISNTTSANEKTDEEKPESVDKGDGQGDGAITTTESVCKKPDVTTKSDNAMPSCSSENKEKPGSSSDLRGMRRLWRSYRENVASRLGSNKFCFVPPHKYIFPEAEYFTWVKSDSESEDDNDNDTTMDSSRELDRTHTTTDSSALDGEVIDLTSDDEDDKHAKKEIKTNQDVDKKNTVEASSKDAVNSVEGLDKVEID